MQKIGELSVFFPTYNEEENIGNVVRRSKGVLLKAAGRWEIIIVNDGSSDKTLEVAEKLVKNDKRIKLVNHKVNRGYGGALKTGFKSARYKWVAFTDSDGQFDFRQITKFIKRQKETDADLILGYRLKRADSLVRKIGGIAWALIPRVFWGLKVRDYSCGFKMIRKDVFNTIQPLIGEEKVTQIEMFVKAKQHGFKFAEVGVDHYPRRLGKQTGADIKVVLKSFVDLFRLWGKLK